MSTTDNDAPAPAEVIPLEATVTALRSEMKRLEKQIKTQIKMLEYSDGDAQYWWYTTKKLTYRLAATQAEVARLREALATETEECAKVAEQDADWTLFQRQSKPDALAGDETNVFAGPDDDGTYPNAKNVFAYTTGLATGRAIAAAIRRRAALSSGSKT